MYIDVNYWIKLYHICVMFPCNFALLRINLIDMQKRNLIVSMLLLLFAFSCTTTSQKQQIKDFVRVENGHFVRNGKPYYYVGTTFGMELFWPRKVRVEIVSACVVNSIP